MRCAEAEGECKPRVTVRCSYCEYVHKVFDYTTLYVFMPPTLIRWAHLECPDCQRRGMELFIDTCKRTESEARNG